MDHFSAAFWFNRHTKILWVVCVCALFQSCIFPERNDCIFDNINPSYKNFLNVRQKRVTGIDIADGWFKGLLEYTPPGYNASDYSKKYPVIIYFGGRSTGGKGTKVDLCKLLWDVTASYGGSLPSYIERDSTVLEHKGDANPYLVISPQFTHYRYPESYPGPAEVDAVIDYVVKNYRVDSNRVYLTGMSSGANMVIEYAGSSVERAKRVAAISVPALCSVPDTVTNIERGIKPAHIGQAKLPVWFMQCEGDPNCGLRIPQGWVNGIVAAGGLAPRFNVLDTLDGTNASSGVLCAGWRHDTWFRMYDPNFAESPNMYDWFIQFSRDSPLHVNAPAGN
jgi:hypothetical protein